MKTKKTNHSERVESLSAQLETLNGALNDAREAWRFDKSRSILNNIISLENQIKDLEREIKFHSAMAQEKAYATQWLSTDAHAYEVIEERTDRLIRVRRMKATIKPEAKMKVIDSFVPGGFCGHFDNSLQEWDYETDETNPIETIRKHKDGKWYGTGGILFTIQAKPYEKYDFNF